MEEKERLIGLKDLSSGERAALKRCAGKCLREADAGALQAFFTVYEGRIPSFAQERYFAVACLACLWKEEERVAPRPLPYCLQIVNRNRDSEGMDHRFRALLDTAWNDEEGFLITKLTRLVKQVKAAGLGISPDFEQLLTDLLAWNHDSRYVQRRWMEQYLTYSEEEKTETEENN